jgi:hypothetical protein
MWKIVVAIILTSAFFVLFFEPYIRTNTVTISKNKVSTTDGFIEDTRDAFIMPIYPTQLATRDETGELEPVYGDIGSFVPYSSVSEYNWLHGFPHEKTE